MSEFGEKVIERLKQLENPHMVEIMELGLAHAKLKWIRKGVEVLMKRLEEGAELNYFEITSKIDELFGAMLKLVEVGNEEKKRQDKIDAYAKLTQAQLQRQLRNQYNDSKE